MLTTLLALRGCGKPLADRGGRRLQQEDRNPALRLVDDAPIKPSMTPADHRGQALRRLVELTGLLEPREEQLAQLDPTTAGAMICWDHQPAKPAAWPDLRCKGQPLVKAIAS
ncbi:hypothetical protein OHR68_20010 [Spirillospora sp. NBC_00431]